MVCFGLPDARRVSMVSLSSLGSKEVRSNTSIGMILELEVKFIHPDVVLTMPMMIARGEEGMRR